MTKIIKFNHKKGVKYNDRRLKTLGAFLCFVGLYILITVFSPVIMNESPIISSIEPHANAEVETNQNMIRIPKLDLQVDYFSGEEDVLNKGAWHRFPERGDPEKGGNFILAAHRFKLAWTPWSTDRSSPFYKLHTLDVGDDIVVKFNQKEYLYKVTKEYEVKPNQTEIESPSTTAKLTLYTCTFGGSDDGRLVIEAELIPS